MPSQAADYNRLSLLVQRLLDAELLREAEGASLLAQAEAARRSLAESDAEAARRHVEQLILRMEALVETGALALIDGRALIQTANRILNPETDAGV